MTELPELAHDAIEQLSDTHDADPETLEADYHEYHEEFAEKGVSDPVRRAVRRLSLDLKGGQMASAEPLRGVVLGASGAINTSESAKNRVKDIIEEYGVKRAMNEGLLKKPPDGEVPKDVASITVTKDDKQEHYAVVDGNSNSPTHGEVLPAKDYIRYVYGKATRKTGESSLFHGVLNSEDGSSQPPPVPSLFEPVAFEAVWRGNDEDSDRNTVQLGFRDTEPFEVADGADFDVIEALESDDVMGHTELAAANSENFGRNDIVVTYGSVKFMELSPDEGQSRRLAITDPFDFQSDELITVWMPEHAEVDFAEDSDVYVVAQVSPSTNPEYSDSLQAVGIKVHPDYKVERQETESMAETESDGETANEAVAEAEQADATTAEVEAAAEDTAETDDTDADEPEATANGGQGEGISNEDQGGFSPQDEDEDWDW